MEQRQSKDELLSEKAASGNIQAIKELVSEGADLEWIDKDGKTPLITACMHTEGYGTAKALIGLDANVNAYRPGRLAGTPLHHAAKRGLEHTVRLLLSNGGSPLLRNDNGQTPLDVARLRGFTNVVRAIESHICFYSGWMKELYGPGFLEALAPQLLSRKIWVVIIPCGPQNPAKPLKLELAIYSSWQDAQPRSIVALQKADIEEPKFHPSDPSLTIFDKSKKTRYRFASPSDGDRQQILALYNACRGIRQVMTSQSLDSSQTAAPTTSSQPGAEAAELAMAMNASIQSAMEDRLQPHPNHQTTSDAANNINGWASPTNDATHNGWGSSEGSVLPAASSNGWMDEPSNEEYNGWGVPESRPNDKVAEDRLRIRPNNHSSSETNNTHGWCDISNGLNEGKLNSLVGSSSSWGVSESMPTKNATEDTCTSHHISPSAPPLPEDNLDEGHIHYPSVDLSPADVAYPCVEQEGYNGNEAKHGKGSSSCVICFEASVEGACVPCGHMAGCMPCLSEIKIRNGECPVCRTKMKEVIRLYAV